MLRLRFNDMSRAQRSLTLPRATAEADALLVAARELLAAATATIERQGLTLLGLTVSNLDGHGSAHRVITSANPASLPPTDTVTKAVLAVRLPSWLCTSGTRAIPLPFSPV